MPRLVCLSLVFVLGCFAAARADPSFDSAAERDWALAGVDYAIAEAEQRIAWLEQGLADPASHMLSVNGATVRVSEAALDKWLGFLRLQYLVDPSRLAELIDRAAQASGVPAFLIEEILGDPAQITTRLATGAAWAKLADRAAKDRPKVEAELAEMRRLLADAKALRAETAGAATGSKVVLCPTLAGGPLDLTRGIFIKFFGDGRVYYAYIGEDFYCGYGTVHTSEFTGEHLIAEGDGYRGLFLDAAGKVVAEIAYIREGSKTDAKGVVWSTGTWRNAANGQSGWYEAAAFP